LRRDGQEGLTLSNVLNVAIGLIFTFLILGLLGTTVHEAAASVFHSRGKLLRSGLQQLLGNGEPRGLLFRQVFDHPLVQSLPSRGLPAYVPAGNFAMALFDSLSHAGHGSRFERIERGVHALAEGPTKHSLRVFIAEADGELDELRLSVEAWFNDAMDRLSGIYKRRSQAIHLGFGLVIALGFNVDSIHIAKVLWEYPARQQVIVAMAQTYAGANPGLPAGSLEQFLQQMAQLPVPMGWDGFSPPATPLEWLYPLFGWLVTGFSVSLGAPFWFDLLQKVMDINVRATGPRPDTT
jgi:hypothetical protein